MNTASPLVSIGVAIYNEEKFLRQSLESILSQDYPHIEIIISDNASTDKTHSICKEFIEKDSRIAYYRSNENIGAHANAFKTINVAKGKYYMYAPGHDLWDPTFVSKAVSLMEEDPEVVLCYSRTMRIDMNDNPLGPAHNSWDLRGLSPVDRLTYLVNHISGGDPCNGLIRLEYLKKFDRKFVWGFDQVMLAYFTLAGTIAHIPEPLFFWRMTDDERVESRKATVPQDNDPLNSRKMLSMSMTELWRQMGEATIQVINESDLSMPEKLDCKAEVRQCFTRRYGVQWNEVIPYDLKQDGKNVLMTTSAPPSQTPFSTNEKRPPVGVGFLISVLRDAGHNVFFVDNYLSPSNFLETDYIQRHQIDFVGIYTNTICYRDSLRMFYRLEEMRQKGIWKGKIIAGGPHASVSPETIPPFVDHIVIGEGEYAIRDIVSGKVTERIVQYPSIENLDELPMPAWDYFAEMPYDWGGNWLPEAPVFTMNTSRGCPFDCTFCSVGSIWGRRYTYFSAERVVADIEHVVRNHGAKGIYFREDNFTLNRKRLYEFCNLMIERGINIPWVCETRASSLDRETVELMARAGAKGAYIGVESGSQRLLDFMHKAIKLEDVRQAFKLCQEFGINTAASIIVGVPTETQQDLQMTMDLLREIKPTVTWFNVFVGIPKSNLYRYVLEHKLYDYIDDRGLVYLKGHNERVRAWYGQTWDAGLPVQIQDGMIVTPKVSVIMSVYNGETYLSEAIKSIQTQSFNNFEFVIVNDASTDRTAEILQHIDDPRIRVLTNQQNLGLTKSLNKALNHCRGEFIARMDADDLSHPLRLEKQVAFLESHPTHALVGSSYYVIDERGRTTSHAGVLTESAQIKAGLKDQNWFGHGSVMMRKSALGMVGGYDEEFRYAQDYDLWLRLSELYDVANIHEPLYFWRNTAHAISRSKAREQKHYAELAKKNAQLRILNREMQQTSPGYPLVSVIVPTYNRPDMLPDTLRSILAQTYPNIEIIVVNDAGQDVERIVTEAAPNAVYLCHERNRGLAGARNTGIRHATGKYIAYLDDDDIFYPEHVATLVTFLEGSDYAVAYSDARRTHQVKECGRYTVVKRDLPYSEDFDYDRILVDNFVPVLCFMHEKQCIAESGYFDETLRRHEDWDLWIRMSRKFRFAHIPKVTGEYTCRVDGSGMITGTVPMFLATKSAIYTKYRNVASLDVQRRQRADMWEFMHHLYTFLETRIAPLVPLFMADKRAEGETTLAALAETGATPNQLKSALANQLALAYLKSGAVTEAVAQFEQAVAADAMNPYASHNLAVVYRKTGRTNDAAKVFRQILDRNESEVTALTALAELASERGETAEARELYGRVLAVEPENKAAAESLARLPACGPAMAKEAPLRVAVFSLDLEQYACAHIRAIAPGESLRGSIELKWGVSFRRDQAEIQTSLIDWADLIIIQRFFPKENTVPIINRILAAGKPVIYETDDLLIEVPVTNPHQGLADNSKPYILGLVSQATAVTVSTEEMKRALTPYHRQIHVLPNLLDDRLWNVPMQAKPSGSPVVIGYAGTPDHKADLRLLEDVLERIAAKYGNRVAFRFMGCDTERIKQLPGFSSITFDPGYANYAHTIRKAGIDIGLVPLEDNRFNRCKSNVKWLEYSACGIAGVYADLPPYRSCVKDGETGLLVAGYDVDAWVAAIESLIDNPDRRHAMALAARTEVLANYTLKSRGHLFLDTWRRIAGRNDTSQAKDQGMNASPQPFAPNTAPTGADAPQVSIIIPLYNKVEYTRQCLEALALNTEQALNYEVILVDNASSDGTAEYLRTLSGDVTIVTNLKNLGFAKACNQGGRIARGRCLVFLNNDTIPHPGWLAGLLRGAEQDGADIVGARLLYPNGRAQHAGVAFNEQSIGYHIFNGFPADAPAVNRKRFMQCVTAACMLVKQELFAELGGFDEGYVNGFEDVDFCLRAGERGRRILYAPESVLIHFEETSEGRKDHDTPNIRRFLARWEGKVRCDHQDIYRSEGYRAERQADGRLRIYQVDAAPVSAAPTPPPTAASTAPQQITPTPGTGAAATTPSVSGREKALVLKAEGRYVEAIEHLVKIVTAGDNSVLVDLGDCLASLEKYDDALALYEESLALCPTNGRALVGIGVVRYMTRRIAEAADAFNRAQEIDPADPKALCGLGMVRCAQGRNAEGFELYDRALEAEPENLTAVHESVRLAYELGRFSEAAKRLESYLRHHPGDIDILFACAGLLHMAGRNADARDALERLLVFSPEYSGAMELLAKLEGRDKEPDREIVAPEAPRLKEDGKYEEALAAFSRAAEAGDSSALADMGDCLAQVGRLDEAAARYLEALDADGTDLKALVGLGVVSLVQGKQVKAVTWFNKALKADPANAKALCGLGMVRNMQNKHDEAFGLFARAMDTDPEGLTALHELIRLSYATGRFDEAGERLDRYLMHHPADLDMVFAQAGIRFKAGRYAEALSSIETVLLFASDYEGGRELREAITQAM